MTQTIQKRSSLLLAMLLFGLLLAACGAEAPAPSNQTQSNTGQPTTAAGTQNSVAQSTTAVVAPTTAAAEPTAAAGAGDKMLRVHQNQYPHLFDPQKSSYSNEIAVLSLVYEGLTRLDENLATVPAAAEGWEYSTDGSVITFSLRSGLKYSDGSPLTAKNYEYALLRTAHPATAGEYQSIIFEIQGAEALASTSPTDTVALEQALANFGVRAVDDQTLVIKLTRPAPYYHTVMGLWVTYPVKQELVEAGGENWWQEATNHLGNGPFQITEILADQRITFTANENYWAGRPKLDGIEFTYVSESSVALEAFRNGQLDIVSPDPSLLLGIKEDPALKDQLVTFPVAESYYMAMNLQQEPFTDQKVREAFSYAFDRATYCEVIRNSSCIPTLGWIPQGLPGSYAEERFGFDPEQARQTLAESSYGGPEGLPQIKLTYNSDDSAAQPRMEWIAGQLRDVLGVSVELNPTEGKTLTALRKSTETHPQLVMVGGWIQDYPDPQNWLSVYWTCNATFAKRIGYCNPEFDELTRKGDVELDPARRLQYYEEAGKLLVSTLPNPFLYNPAANYLVSAQVTGYTPTAMDSEWPGQWGSLLTIDVQR